MNSLSVSGISADSARVPLEHLGFETREENSHRADRLWLKLNSGEGGKSP